MKKIAILFLSIFILFGLSACGNRSRTTENIALDGSNGHIYDNEMPPYDAEAHTDDFKTFGILSFEEVPGSIEAVSTGRSKYKMQWKVRNNSDWTLLNCGARICFYDEENTVIYSEERTLNYGLESNQAAYFTFWCDSDFTSCKIVSYNYLLPNNNTVFPDETNCVTVDIPTESVRFWIQR